MTEEIRLFASLQFCEAEIVELLDLSEAEALRRFSDPEDAWAAALRKGHLLGEAKARKALFDFAAEGSVPAAKEALALVRARKGGQ